MSITPGLTLSGKDPRLTLGLSLQARAPLTARPRQFAPLPTRRTGGLARRPGALQLEDLAAMRQRRALPDWATGERKNRSLFRQISDNVSGLPKGLLHLGAQGVTSAVAPFRAVYDYTRGDLDAGDAANIALGGLTPNGLSIGALDRETRQKYMPLQTEMADSMVRTAGNLRHPSRYLRAIDDGAIVDTLLEDVGNVSVVLGPAAKALGAGATAAKAGGMARTGAALDRAASVTARAGAVGGSIADAPLTVYRRGMGVAGNVARESSLVRQGMRGVAGAADTGFARALESEGRMGDAARTVRTRSGLRMTEEGRLGYGAAREGVTRGNRSSARVNGDLYEASKEGGFRTAEEGAAMADLNQVGRLDQIIQEEATRKGLNLTPDQVRKLHVLENTPEQTFTADVQAAFADVAPEVQARIAAAKAAAAPVLNRLQDSAINGEGRVGPMNPAQLGDAPIDQYVIGQAATSTSPGSGLLGAGVAQADIDTLMQMRAGGDTWFDLEQIMPELTDVLNDPMSYPSAWRPVMTHARRANAAGDASLGTTYGLNIPVRPGDLLARGLERPTYLPGGRSQVVNPKSYKLGREPTNIGSRGIQGVGADKARIASEIQPYSLRALADKAGSTIRSVEGNKAWLKFAQDDRLLAADTVLGPQLVADIHANAERAASAAVNRSINGIVDTHPKGAKIDYRESQAYKEHYGDAVVQALKEKGYEIFAGDPKDPQVGDFNPDLAIDIANVTPDAIVLPIGVKARLVQQMAGKELNMPLQFLRRVNKHWKGAVLPFSVRWHLGDLVGGAFMSWMGGGIPPTELIASMRQLKDLSPAAREAIIRNPDFVDQGLTFEESRWRNDGPDAKVLRKRNVIAKVQKRSFKANETINRVNRQGYLLAKTQRVLDQYGLNIDAVDQMDGWDHPDVQAAITEAVTDANKTMGTFDELTPLESRWMKNIFPFYVWSRHITMLAARTADDHPARVVWMLRLGAYGADTSELPEWLRGSITVPDALMPDFIAKGDALVPTNFLNPFNDVVSQPAFTPQGIARSLSPGLKVPLAFTLGLEPGNSFAEPFRPITRPYGENRNMFTDAIAAGLRSFPITREAMYVAPTGSIGPLGLGPHPRYNSGRNMVDNNGNPIDTNPRALGLMRLIGLPAPTPVEDADAIVEAANKQTGLMARKRRHVVYG